MSTLGIINTFCGKFYVLGGKGKVKQDLKALMKKSIILKDTLKYEDDGIDVLKSMEHDLYELMMMETYGLMDKRLDQSN